MGGPVQSKAAGAGRVPAIHRSVHFPIGRLALLSIIVALSGFAELQAPALAQTHGGPPSIAPIAEKLINAVVNISTNQTLKGAEGAPLPKVPKGAPFEEFFEDFFNRKGARPPAERKVSAQGSGFVIDGKEGLIVTNNHVIDGADEIVINFSDGSKLKVEKVIGKDTKTDLALLKVNPKHALAQARFGSSTSMKVGDWVMAIGNPFGLGGSVSVGIISAKQRDINTGPYDDYLQTDAAINKGNSGGPLFNMDGEVIGVNTAIISPTGFSVGIGFAVPSDVAVVVVDQLRLYGETRRGWLGVNIQSISEDLAETYGLKENTGAFVSSVAPGGPAAKAGIQDGDVILRFDGKDVISMRSLRSIVAQTQIGREVDVEVVRKGQRKTFKVAVGRLAEGVKSAPKSGVRVTPKSRSKAKEKDSSVQPQTPAGRSLIGLVLAPLTDELRTKHGLNSSVRGVIVLEVDPASSAAQRNVKAGDVIVEAAQAQVTSIEDVVQGIERMRTSGRNAVLLRLEDAKGDLRFVAVPVE
jgi:serine protease Do